MDLYALPKHHCPAAAASSFELTRATVAATTRWHWARYLQQPPVDLFLGCCMPVDHGTFFCCSPSCLPTRTCRAARIRHNALSRCATRNCRLCTGCLDVPSILVFMNAVLRLGVYKRQDCMLPRAGSLRPRADVSAGSYLRARYIMQRLRGRYIIVPTFRYHVQVATLPKRATHARSLAPRARHFATGQTCTTYATGDRNAIYQHLSRHYLPRFAHRQPDACHIATTCFTPSYMNNVVRIVASFAALSQPPW